MNVLFVCTGNINRSAIAEVILKEKWNGDVKSCGTGKTAAKRVRAASRMRRSAAKYGYPLESHRSQPITVEMCDWADIIVAMGNPHSKWVKENSPENVDKVQQWDIPDPHFDSDPEACDRCLVAIRDKIDDVTS